MMPALSHLARLPVLTDSPAPQKTGVLRRIPAGVWALGCVSMMMDTSSEMIHSLLPLFMTGVLGLGAAMVGMIEGAAEAAAALLKIYSGVLSDRMGKRKPLALAGYGLAALSKPLFPMAETMWGVLAARMIDRVGKGVRGAPRDALVADLTPPDLHGAAYGLRQAVDNIGAVAGPLLAMALMALTGDDFRLVFWIAVIPALISVAVLFFAVKDPPAAERKTIKHFRHPWERKHLRLLPPAFWFLVGVSGVMGLARFSEAFLVLLAADTGQSPAMAPLTLAVMNVVYAAAAFPVGALSDRWGRRGLLLAGFAALAVADIVLAAATGPALLLAGSALWGLHMGMTQGLLAAAVADAAPEELRGTAFGMFNLVAGLALLTASALAGVLWATWGAEVTFLTGAAFSVLAGLALLAGRRHLPA